MSIGDDLTIRTDSGFETSTSQSETTSSQKTKSEESEKSNTEESNQSSQFGVHVSTTAEASVTAFGAKAGSSFTMGMPDTDSRIVI